MVAQSHRQFSREPPKVRESPPWPVRLIEEINVSKDAPAAEMCVWAEGGGVVLEMTHSIKSKYNEMPVPISTA